jgi:hypothetical protein
MNKNIPTLFFIIIFLSCTSNEKLTLNSIFNQQKNNNTYIYVPNGSLIKSFSIIKNHIEYKIGISSNNRIIYICTTDEKFSIKGLKINDILPDSFFKNQFGYRLGWGYFIEIDSGWYAGFNYQTKPNIESKIEWFFQFDFNN